MRCLILPYQCLDDQDSLPDHDALNLRLSLLRNFSVEELRGTSRAVIHKSSHCTHLFETQWRRRKLCTTCIKRSRGVSSHSDCHQLKSRYRSSLLHFRDIDTHNSPSACVKMIPLLSSRWLFLVAFSSLLHFLSTVNADDVNISSKSDGIRENFLRKSIITRRMNIYHDEDSFSAPRIDNDVSTRSRRLLEEPPYFQNELEEYQEGREEEDFDYEKYHFQHNIPLPVFGVSMMGMNKRSHSQLQGDVQGNDGMRNSEEGHIFPFTGTKDAVKLLAVSVNVEDTDEAAGFSNEYGRNRFFSDGNIALSDTVNELKEFNFSETNEGRKNAGTTQLTDINSRERRTLLSKEKETDDLNSSFDNIIQQISQARSSLLWGQDRDGESTGANGDSDLVGLSLSALALSKKYEAPVMNRSASDLDRGRYLVGLEIREVQSHQQIIIDYASAVTDDSGSSRKPLRIQYLLSQWAELNNESELFLEVIKSSLDRASHIWGQALTLLPVIGRIYPTVETCGGAKIPIQHRERGVDDADILIYVSMENTFCAGALMYSAICDFDQFMRPVVGNINICVNNFPLNPLDNDLSNRDSVLNDYASYLTLETGRVLGASMSLFRFYINPDTSARYGTTERSITCVDGSKETLDVPNIIAEDMDSLGRRFYEIRTAKVIEVVRNHFNCMTITGVRTETRRRDSIGCYGGFFDDRIFYSEQMTAMQAVTYGPSISPLTLALLEDSSWYVANYRVSTETSFGRGAGCLFARDGCQRSELETELSIQNAGFHCTKIGELGCDASHSFKAKCDFLDGLGQFPDGSDFLCPMYFRQGISCSDNTGALESQEEYYGKSSKCFVTDRGEPMCLQSKCNEINRTVDVFIGNETFSCMYDGQIINTNRKFQMKCPRIASICPILFCPSSCAGKGVCDEDREGKHSCICDDPFDDTPGCYGDYT